MPDLPPVVDIGLTRLELRTGLRITGEHDLAPLVYTDLTDDEVVEIMQRLAKGEPPGVDLGVHCITRDEWERRRRTSRRLLQVKDPMRRHLRKAKKRKVRPR